MEISVFQIEKVIRIAAELGAVIALVKTGKLKPYLKKAEAFRLYNRANVEHWIEDGLITPRKDGGHSASWRIDRIELETVVKSRLLFQIL